MYPHLQVILYYSDSYLQWFYPLQCKRQHNENQLILWEQIANCLSGSWDHQKNQQLHQMPDSIIKTARDFRNFFEEKMFKQFVFHITFYENLLPNIQKCMCLEELGGRRKLIIVWSTQSIRMKGMTYPTIISQHLPNQSQSHHHILCKKSSDWISYWVEYYLWMLWKLSIKLVLSSVRYLRISMLRKMSLCSSPKSNGKGFKRCSWEAPPQCFHICLLKVWSITLIKQLHEEKHYIQLSKLNHSFFFFGGILHTPNQSLTYEEVPFEPVLIGCKAQSSYHFDFLSSCRSACILQYIQVFKSILLCIIS